MVDRGVILAQLAQSVARVPQELPLVSRLCQACMEVLEADGVALTLGYTTDRRITVCAIGETSSRLEDLQEVLGEGPGRDSFTEGRRVAAHLPSPADGRWPMLSAAVRHHLREIEVLALPLENGKAPFGVMTVHRVLPFSGEEQVTAQFVADAVGAAIVRDESGSESDPPAPWLSRSRVHLATGMVVAQLQLAPQDALALIRAFAFAQDQSINDVAENIIDRRVHLDGWSPGEVDP